MSEEVIASGILDWGSTPHISTHGGARLRQGVIVVTVDADELQMQTTSYPSTAASLLPEMVDRVRFSYVPQ